MKLDANTRELLNIVSRFLHRYHILIFALVVLGGLSGATFSLYQEATPAHVPEAPTSSTAFDKETIDKLKNLNDASNVDPNPVLPSGRSNPFKE